MPHAEELDELLEGILKDPRSADITKLDNYTVKEIRLKAAQKVERLQTNNQAASIVSVVILITTV